MNRFRFALGPLLACGIPAIAVFAGSTVLAPDLAAQEADTLPRVFPVDEADENPGFFAFRARLLRASAERDTAALLAVVDSTIKLSFGGSAGIEDFRREWLDSPENDIWVELGAALSLGGRFWNDSSFYAPYTFHPFAGREEPPGYDPYGSLIVVDDAVPVLSAPRPRRAEETGADTLAVLSFAVVSHEWRTSVADPPAGWTAIRLADGPLGFVESRFVRSPNDYRAIFTRRGTEWRMTIFIAGD